MTSSGYKICPGCGAHLQLSDISEKRKDYFLCRYCNTVIDREVKTGSGNRKGNQFLKKLLVRPGRNSRLAVAFVLALISAIVVMVLSHIPKEESAPLTPESIEEENLQKERASLNGKYRSLIQVLKCPGDRKSYGTFSDYGYWGGGRWCGQTGKAGYWVWIYPHWYIWEYMDKDSAASMDPSVNGKYFDLIQVLPCPGDRKKYRLFQDYGYWGGGRWCGETGKAGYWVWIAPKWYIWEGRK
jgi:hypothetical protein